MAKAHKVLSQKQLPMRSPILAGIVFGLLLDRLDSPGWVWGVVATLWLIMLIAWGCSLWFYEPVELDELK